MKHVRDIKAGDITPWWEAVEDAETSDGMISCKVRLPDGTEETRTWREDIKDHLVTWEVRRA